MAGRLVILAFGVFAVIVGFFAVWATWRYQTLAQDVAWLEDQSFDTLTLLTVGTGSAYENPKRLGPVSAVGFGARIALVDAGRGAAEALRRCAIRTSQPDTVYLTSLLPENVLGLDDLLLTGWLAERRTPLRLVGPAGTRAFAEALAAAQRPAIEALAHAVGLPPEGASLEALEVEPGWSETRDDGVVVRAGDAGARPLPALAWRFERPAAAGEGPLALVVTGAGAEPDAVAPFAQGAALLVTEGFFRAALDAVIESGDPDADRLRREAALHLSTAEAGALAQRAGVPLLVLTRLRPPPMFDEQFETSATGAGYTGRVVVADDCDAFRGGA